jgi:Flp pilus assembly protein protease CpaA
MEIVLSVLVLVIVFLALWLRSLLSVRVQLYVSIIAAFVLIIMLLLEKADLYWSVLLMAVILSSIYTQYLSFKREAAE